MLFRSTGGVVVSICRRCHKEDGECIAGYEHVFEEVSELQKCAEILMKCGYAGYIDNDRFGLYICWKNYACLREDEICNPFADSLEGRRQACSAIEHIRLKHNQVWLNSKFATAVTNDINIKWWEHALARLKWCISELCKEGK